MVLELFQLVSVGLFSYMAKETYCILVRYTTICIYGKGYEWGYHDC